MQRLIHKTEIWYLKRWKVSNLKCGNISYVQVTDQDNTSSTSTPKLVHYTENNFYSFLFEIISTRISDNYKQT